MTYPNMYAPEITMAMIGRINTLTPESMPRWGKMNVSQMLAHCNVAYEMAYEKKHPAPNAFMKFILKLFVKNTVTGPKPYKKNSPTAPAFIIKDVRDFGNERTRLI